MTTILTAALPYANGDIHIGHLVEYAQADIYARTLKLMGEECIFVCADDAHGTPVQLRAEAEKASPEDLIGVMRQRHIADFALFNVDFDFYHSTHSPENKALVEEIFDTLNTGGYIFQRSVDQWFDPAAERFLADRFVKGECPRCGAADQYGDACEVCGATYDALELKSPVSQLSGQTPQKKSSMHFFFDLPRLEGFLKEWGKSVGLQAPVRNKLAEWFEQGLRPWDISRDAPYFGFEIPGQPGKYFYVWLDAPIGYIASLIAYCAQAGLDARALWQNPDNRIVHIIGKDIAYFHTLFWPALLEAGGWRTPSQVQCHGFLTVDGRKMSKSRGTFITAAQMADEVEPDLFRYFLFTRLNDRVEDIDFMVDAFVERINSDIVNTVVNLGARSAKILHQHFDAQLVDYDGLDQEMNAMRGQMEGACQLAMEFRMADAARWITSFAAEANKAFADAKPWVAVKGDKAARASAHIACTRALAAFRAAMIALSPAMPVLSRRALEIFDPQAGPSNPAFKLSMVGDKSAILNKRIGEFGTPVDRIDAVSIRDNLGLGA